MQTNASDTGTSARGGARQQQSYAGVTGSRPPAKPAPELLVVVPKPLAAAQRQPISARTRSGVRASSAAQAQAAVQHEDASGGGPPPFPFVDFVNAAVTAMAAAPAASEMEITKAALRAVTKTNPRSSHGDIVGYGSDSDTD